ncbi:MAG: AraC family transcriptional regulator [Pseudomonadota bacterium]
MARAIAVHHGSFGRATLYELDNPLITHAHREGHLIFYLGGGRGKFVVRGECYDLDENNAVAVSPWEPHSYAPVNEGVCSYLLTLYIKPMWFLENNRSAEFALKFGTPHIHMTPEVEKWVGRLSSLLLDDQPSSRFDGFLFETCLQCFDQSWEGAEDRPLLHSVYSKFSDFRVRRSLRLMQECYSHEVSIDTLAKEVGLSRPHFFKLFKMQMGVTPNLYLNTLRAEHAIDDLMSTSKTITEIGFDLGFASQAGFTRFFTSNVGIPPTDYRRVAHFV